ncbi:HAMP domain-containing histidine kinase [Microcoleus sp. FACHB-SPT15]|jgi:signal transduction histidine kinase|nr:HAMP domain-containing sensor histidine kinase [Microcoleus sp. FACHB-SPT15]MBD1808390.1 HAMP domain-containing histidine kinase [Microcoleus sp. FACHB-SPT15]
MRVESQWRIPAALDVSLPSSLMHLQTTYQFYLDELAAQLPVVAAWGVFRCPETGKYQRVAYYERGTPCFVPAIIAYLESEQWWDDSLSAFKLSELALDLDWKTYVCNYTQQPADPEYLLIWSSEPLSRLQQYCIEQQARIFRHHLDTYQERSRQSRSIQLLEQTLQKTEHQLRSPLALIALHADLLSLSLPLGQLRSQAQSIRETVDEVSVSLTQLTNCGLRSRLQLDYYDLREILEESIAGLQPWIQQKQLRIDYPVTPLKLKVDRWQIKQVLSNLLSNAVQFSPPRAVVTCRWQAFCSEVLIEICDKGSGLSAEDVKELFTPFYSRRPGGTGLGLAIAKKIVLDHQGSIWADNLPEGGAQFSITLPRSA